MNDRYEDSRAFVNSLDLPEQGPRLEAAPGEEEPPVRFESSPQAVVIGAQLAEFATSVNADARRAISDNLLIAQLAANKAADSANDVLAWYRKYVGVLQNLGWLVGAMEFREQKVSDANSGLHTAIIPVLTSMLAPGMGALPLVLSVLDGLKEMDGNAKWLTLFDRASQHARGAKFQLSQVEADAGGNPQISVFCFGLLAEHTVTQVLFFRFSQDSADLKSASGSLSMSSDQLAATKAEIAARVRPFVSDFVRNVEL